VLKHVLKFFFYVLKLMWIPFHVGLLGNELVDERQAALEGFIFDRPLSSSNFLSLARLALMGMAGKMGLCGYW
jgi:hypothetical protein